MTTTLAALQTGKVRIAFVAAIDGYPHLLSVVPQALVQAAWASTDWATAAVIPHLMIELDNHQQIDPWEPFQGGGKIILKVQPDSADTFAIDIHRSDAGEETPLAATVLRTSTEIPVAHADRFTTSEIHIGTECLRYKIVSGNSFQLYGDDGAKRGKYCAFTAYNQSGFAEHHRVTTANNGVRLQPVVSEQPRTWTGRRMSLWMHVYEADGSLNSKTDALCVFVGGLEEARDVGASGHTHVFASSILDQLKDATLGRDMFEATIGGGHFLSAGMTFKFQDKDDLSSTGTLRNANSLVVVASGASDANHIDAGMYTIEEIASVLNRWFASELAAGRVWGSYTIASPETVSGAPRTVMHYYIPSGTGTGCYWKLTWPYQGWGAVLGAGASSVAWFDTDTNNAGHATWLPLAPQPAAIFSFDHAVVEQGTTSRLRAHIEHATGLFQDQAPTLPAAAKPYVTAGGFVDDQACSWGLFIIELEQPLLILGTVLNGELREAWPLNSPTSPASDLDYFVAITVPIGSPPPKIRQVFLHEGRFSDVMRWLFYSTGTRNYNHPTHDLLPYGQGLGLPYGMLGANFEDTLDLLPRASDTILVCIDKPRRLSEVLAGDLVLRRAHLVWREGGLRWCHWSSPSQATAAATLDEGTKAELFDDKRQSADHRAPSTLDSTWVRNVVKLQYDRDITKIAEGGSQTYRSPPLIIEDATSVDDQGGKTIPQTIDCVNVYSDYDGMGTGITALAAGFASFMPFFSRPVWKTHRSIGPRHYEAIGVGDCVLITDPFVRDPATGARGVAGRPGLIVRHRYQIITSGATEPMKLAGELDVAFIGNDRAYRYAPSADVVSVDGTGTIVTCEAHAHSEPTEAADVSNFVQGDSVWLIEIDPADPANPSVVGNRNIVSVDAANNQIVLDLDLAIAGYVSTKRYRVQYDWYSSGAIQLSQHARSFQADSSGRVGTTTTSRTAYQYGIQPSANLFGGGKKPSLTFDTSLPELPSVANYTDMYGAFGLRGTPRDAGTDKELALLLENLMDYKTARCNPVLKQVSLGFTDPPFGASAANGVWTLLDTPRPMFIDPMFLAGGVNRYLWIRPYWIHDLVGTNSPLAQLRITLSGSPPTGAANVSITRLDPQVTQYWTAVGGAILVDDDEKPFSLAPFNGYDWIWCIVEGTNGAGFRGLTKCVQRARVFETQTPAQTIADNTTLNLGGLGTFT